MANELQTKLDAILEDKNTNLLPENLKKNITCLGITGTYEGSGGGTVEGIKQFSTVEEMNNSTGNKEGDLAVVYRSEIQNATVDSRFQTATFPETVVLDTAITDYVEVRYRAVDSSVMFECMGQLDSSRFRMDCYTESNRIRIQYTSSDGITYTRTDTTGNPVDFGTEIYYEMPEMWNDVIGKFIQASGNTFEGLYSYQHYLSNHLVNAAKNVSGDGTFEFQQTDLKPLLDFLTDAINNNTLLSPDGLTLYTYSYGYRFLAVVNSATSYSLYSAYMKNTTSLDTVYCELKSGPSNKYEWLIKNDSGWGDNGIRVDIDISNKTITSTYITDGTEIVNTSRAVVIPLTVKNSSIMVHSLVVAGSFTMKCDFVTLYKYLDAPTQLTLTKANELLPGKIGYGKNGVVTGDGTIYSNLDGLTLLSTVLGYTPETVSNSPIFSKANDIIPIDTFLGEIYTNDETDCVAHLLKDEDILTSVKSKINEYVGTTDMTYNLVGVKNNELLFKAYKYAGSSGENCVVHCAACKYSLETNQFTNKVYTTYNVSERSMQSNGEKYFPDINMLIISAYGYNYKNIYVLVNYNDMTIHYILKSSRDTSVGEVGYYLVGDYIYSFNGNSANDFSVDRIKYTDYTLTAGVITLSGSREQDYNSFILNNQQYVLYLDRNKNLYLFTPKTNGTVTKTLLATFTATNTSYPGFITIVNPAENKVYAFSAYGNVTLNNNLYIGFTIDSNLRVTWLLDSEWNVKVASSSSIPSMNGIITRYNDTTNTLTSISMSSTYSHVICDFNNKHIIDRSSDKNTFGESLPYGVSVANIYNKTDYTDDNMNITIIDYYTFINDTIKKIRNCYCFGNVLTTMNNTANKDVYSIVIKHGQDTYNTSSIIILNTNLLNNKINQVLNTNQSTQQ